MQFDVAGALKAGATPDQIAQFLAQKQGFDLDGALGAGASVDQVIGFLAKPIETKEAGIVDRLKDTGIDVAKGFVGAGEALVGVGNLVSGNLVGDSLAKIGFDPKRTKEILSSGYSEERQAENAAVRDAEGFVGTARSLLENPAVAIGSMVESAPMMLGSAGAVRAVAGGMLARAGIAPGTAAAAEFLKRPEVLAKLATVGSAAEGATTAGSIQEQARQEGSGYADSAGYALAGGAGTALIGKAASKLLPDADVIAGTLGMGGRNSGAGFLGAAKGIGKGMVQEGVLEEMPQSAQEQAFTNLATSKPWNEGVAESAAQGLIVGAAMGGGVNLVDATSRRRAVAEQALQQATDAASAAAAANEMASVDLDAAVNEVEQAVSAYLRPDGGIPTPDQAMAQPTIETPQPLTPQEKQELARQQLQSTPVADPLAELRLQVNPSTTMADVAQRRDAVETSAIERMMAEDMAARPAAQELAPPVATPAPDLAQASAQETTENQLVGLEQKTRERMVNQLMESAAEPSGYFASRMIPAIDQQLAVLKQPPLTPQERERVVRLTGAAQAFTQPTLPEAPAPAIPDRGADNTSLEARIPEKIPRPSRILGQPTSSYTDDQLTRMIEQPDIPAVSRRGASIELTARQAAQSKAATLTNEGTMPQAAPVLEQPQPQPAPVLEQPAMPAVQQQEFEQNPPPAQQTPAVAATETVAPTTPIQLGRDQTPLAEGGKPFKTRMAADLAAQKSPGAAVLPVVGGGFLVRPQEPVNVQDVPQAPEVPQAAPAISQPGQSPQAVGAQPAGTAYFSTKEKAADFVAKSGIKDTHEVVQTGKVRFEVMPKVEGARQTKNDIITERRVTYEGKPATLEIIRKKDDPTNIDGARIKVDGERLPALNLGAQGPQTDDKFINGLIETEIINGNNQRADGQPAGPAAGVPAEGAGAVEAAGVSDQLEDALIKERDATTSAIENDWMNGNGRRRLTNIERAIHDAVTASTLDADSAAQIIETALENDRPDLAQYAASRAMRAAKSMDTTPGVPQSSPKYGKIKSDLEASKKQALDAASALQEIVNSKQAPQAVAETYDPQKVEALNTAKYAAVPIEQHLASLSQQPAPQAQDLEQNPPPAQQTPAVAATETIAPTTPVQLGRDQTPLAEGGKPFKTRAQAAEAKKLQPMMRVVSVPGGYALAEKTAAQIAAQEKAAQRLRQARTSPKGEPIPAHAFIAANGGMQYTTKSDMGVDGNPRIGNRSLFAAAGRGLSIERATEMLVAEGYLSQGASHNDAYAIIKKSLTQPQYNADGIERIAEMESAAQFEDYLAAQEEMERDPWEDVPAILEEYTADELAASGYDAAPDAIKAEVQALLEMADARGIDGETILLQAHEQTRNATERDYYEAAKSALEEAIQGSPGNRSAPAGRQGEEGASEEIDDDGITVRPGKGAIKDKFFAIVNGDTIPGGPFNTEAEAFDAGIEWRKNQAERAAQDTNERARRERIAQKFIRGEPVSSAEIESLDMRAGTSDMRWFMSRAASLFGLNARDIRPIVKDMIRVSLTDMGAKREFVPTRQALEAIASKVKADGTLTAPTRDDILASQDRASNERTLQAREQIRRESEAGAGLFELTMEDGRQDTTGALFSRERGTETPRGSKLATPSDGRIVNIDATATGKAPVPGSKHTVQDGETSHSFTVVDSSRLGAQGRLIQQIARIFGKRVVAFQSDTLQADGFVMNDDQTSIYLNVESTVSPMAVFGHELTHQMKKDNPQAYAALEAVVQRNMGEEGMAKFREEYGEEADIEELSSDLVGDRFREPAFWEDVFNEIAAQNPTGAAAIVQRVGQAIRKAVDTLLKTIRQQGFNADAYVTNLEEIRDAVRVAMVDYAKQQREPAMAGVKDAPATDGEGATFSGSRKVEPEAKPNTAKITRRRNYGDLTSAQEEALRNVGGIKPDQTVKERFEQLRSKFDGAAAGIADQFAELRALDKDAYMEARLSKGTDGTLEALMLYGKPFITNDGAVDVDIGDEGFAKVLGRLEGEQDRFLWWVAAQRAERLKAQGLERLFSDQDITALKELNRGNLPSGTPRGQAYARALQEMNDFNDAVLKVAEQSGLIDPESRKLFKDTPYVPFYRVMDEEGGVKGPSFSGGLTNQYAWKKLKGGKQKLNEDLLSNVLMNWSHLYAAAAKNRAATAALKAGVRAGIAERVPSGTKGSIRVRDAGKEVHYLVSDEGVLAAISAIEYKTPRLFRILGTFKRMLSLGVTASPTYKVKNLIRDSVSAVAISDLSFNVAGNVASGFKATAKDSQTFASMLAGGGLIRFGAMLDGNNADRTRKMVAKEGGYLLDREGWKKVSGMVEDTWDAYNELGDRLENANRASLYEQLLKKGYSQKEANFMARDLMDFTMQGRWGAVRFLTEVVPFMNARIQGLYKLGKAAKADPQKFGYVVGAVALASIALLTAYEDDEDWKKRPDWDRDTNWWFKIGGVAFRIPKPFEVGAIGTLAERGWELAFNKEMDVRRFGRSLSNMIFDTFAMDPTPQIVKPLIDIYANRAGFTNGPIESMAMQRLRPEDRYNERTSYAARFLGQIGLPSPMSFSRGQYESMSPMQIDYLVRGYFGWLGTAVTTTTDIAMRPMMGGGERPDMRLRDVFFVGNFVETLPSGSSRYLEQVYEQSKEIEQAYNSHRAAIKRGDREEAAKIFEEEKDKIRAYKRMNQFTDRISDINGKIKRVESSQTLSGESKRKMIDQLNERRNKVAERASKVVKVD